jgi:hypothetical protein
MELFEIIETEFATEADEPVFQWRLEQLARAGYDECDALELAARSDIDLHTAVELRANGCPSQTAYDILT